MAKHRTAGLPPGALVFTGVKKVASPDLTVYYYDHEHLHVEDHLPDPDKVSADNVLWIDVRGLHEIALVERVGKQFGMHPLAMEDIVDIHQRPKYDEYESGFFMILRSLQYDPQTIKMIPEQVSMYCGEGFVLSFQEDADDLFTSIRKRIDTSYGRIRSRTADYLTYALADMIVDNYFGMLDAIGDDIEIAELAITENPTPQTKLRLHQLKQCTLEIRRALSPLREAISQFSRSELEIIDDRTKLFLRDLYDHVLRAIEINETYREALSGLHDLHISELSFRMNNIMQVLTIIATIFIPLTFFAGIYGMNFDYMPELHYKYAYFILLGFMLVIAIVLIIFFRRKKWL